MQYLRPRVPDFHPFRSTINHFQDIAPVKVSRMGPVLKLQGAANIFIFGRLPRKVAARIPSW